MHCMLNFYNLAKSTEKRLIWLKFRLYFSQIELKMTDLAKKSLVCSNIFVKFAT